VPQEVEEEEEGEGRREEKEEREVARQEAQKRSGLGVDVESDSIYQADTTQYSVLCACVYNTLYTVHAVDAESETIRMIHSTQDILPNAPYTHHTIHQVGCASLNDEARYSMHD